MQPVVGDLKVNDYGSDRSGETFELNRYSVNLTRYGIGVRLTASERVGVHEYTFPASDQAKILFDAGSHMKVGYGESQQLVASGVKVLSDTEVEGYSTVKGGWNMGDAYTVYFYARTDTPAKSTKVWKGSAVSEDKEISATGSDKNKATPKQANTRPNKIQQPPF